MALLLALEMQLAKTGKPRPKVIGIDDQKRIRLSRKAVLKERAAGSLVS